MEYASEQLLKGQKEETDEQKAEGGCEFVEVGAGKVLSSLTSQAGAALQRNITTRYNYRYTRQWQQPCFHPPLSTTGT